MEKKYPIGKYQVTSNPLETNGSKASLYLTKIYGGEPGSELIADFESLEKANEICDILNKHQPPADAERGDKLALLKKHYFNYYRPSFPTDERTMGVVNQALCIKEETEAIFKAMDEYAATPQGIGWVKDTLPTIAREYYCKCRVDGQEKRLIVEFDNNGKWGEAPGYDYYEDFEITEWLDESQPQPPQVSKEILDFIRDVAKNWDCDEDGHKYNTGCRKCSASELLYDLTRKEVKP